MYAVAGVADFSGKGLSLDKVGKDKVLTATATLSVPGTTTTTTSPAFTVTLPANSIVRGPGSGIKIHMSDLLSADQAWDDSTLTYTSESCDFTTANGVSLAVSGSGGSTLIVYPSSTDNRADSFHYNVSDSQSGTWTVTINISINLTLTSQSAEISVNGGVATMKFYGVPTYHYAVQRKPDANGTWADMIVSSSSAIFNNDQGYSVLTAPAAGVFTVTCPASGTSAVFQLRAAP